jgi:hypothetical protein
MCSRSERQFGATLGGIRFTQFRSARFNADALRLQKLTQTCPTSAEMGQFETAS